MEGLETFGISVRTFRAVVGRILALLRRATRRWPVAIVTFFAAVAAFFIGPRLMPPVYRSETVLIYREVIEAGNLLGSDYEGESARQATQRLRETLMSRTNLEQIVVRLELYPDVVTSQGLVEAVEKFRESVDCLVRDDTVDISFQGPDPDVVYDVTKALADSLMEESRKYRVEQAESTKKFLEAQTQTIETELLEKEERRAQFLAAHPEFAADVAETGVATAGASVRATRMRSDAPALDVGLDALRRQADRLRQQLEAPVPVVPAAEVPPELAAQLSQAQEELNSARATLEERKQRFTSQHPDVQAAIARVRAAQEKHAEVQNRVRLATRQAPAPADPEAAREEISRKLRGVEVAIAQRQGKSTAQPETTDSSWIVELETEWAGLNRQVEEVRERYEQIQSRLFRASILASVEDSGQATQMEIVDEAYRPKRPSGIGPRRLGAMAALAVVLLGALLMLSAAILDDRLYDEVDVKALGLGTLVHVIPKKGRRGLRRG